MSNVLRWSPEQLAEYERKVGRPLKVAAPQVEKPTEAKRGKYGNKAVEYQGMTFDSKKELKRWLELKAMEEAGEIRELDRQVKFVLAPAVQLDGRTKPALRYFADATYWRDTVFVVEDTKSSATRKSDVYRVKKHLMRSVHNIEVQEQ